MMSKPEQLTQRVAAYAFDIAHNEGEPSKRRL